MTITDMHTHKCTYTQRCKCYPIDASSGLHISIINQKVLLLVVVVVVYLISSLAIDLIHTYTHTQLSELLRSSSSYTRPLVHCLSGYCDKIESNPFSQVSTNMYVCSGISLPPNPRQLGMDSEISWLEGGLISEAS